jgi:ubiquinone/menaquinone biosynthesis C-methylase UbiE
MTGSIEQSQSGKTVASPYEGLATRYNRARPAYPDEAIADLGGRAGDLAVDVGAGTGIFTRQLAVTMNKARVVGVEPSADMRRAAQAASIGMPNLAFMAGTAEALPFENASVAVVTAATAAHWFDRPAFYAEAFRCLRPGGQLVILQNVRRWWESDFLAAYETLHESTVPGYWRGTFPAFDGGFREIDVATELSGHPDVAHIAARAIDWSMAMTTDEFIDFSQSSSITQRSIAAIGYPAYLARLESLLAQHTPSGLVALPYVTHIVKATRGSDHRTPTITPDLGEVS